MYGARARRPGAVADLLVGGLGPDMADWGYGGPGAGVHMLVGRAGAQGISGLVSTHWWVKPGPGFSFCPPWVEPGPVFSGCLAQISQNWCQQAGGWEVCRRSWGWCVLTGA